MRRISLLTATLLLVTLRIFAQSGASSIQFIENKGQWDSKVKFKGDLPTGAFFLEKAGFSVVQHNTSDLTAFQESVHGDATGTTTNNTKNSRLKEQKDKEPNTGMNDPGAIMIRSHAYRVTFVDASEQIAVQPDKALPTYNNYFIGNDPSKWQSNVGLFQAVVYQNVYPHIDVRYYSEYGRLKYDWIVHPGGDVSKILMRYEGADKLSVKRNELIIKTSVGEVKELYPYSYEFDNTTGRKEVACFYELADKNTVRFRVGEHASGSTLIIDPSLRFSSFTGSTSGEWGFTATPGPDGSLFSGSIVFGTGFRTSPGAFQTNFSGGANGGNGGGAVDIGIFKFSPNGNARVYATYLGGSSNEYPHSLICDPQGELIVLGRTYSTNFPVNAPSKLEGPGGSSDITVTKLNAAGSGLIGSLRIGGSGLDGVNVADQRSTGGGGRNSILRFYGDDSRSEVILDGAGNIYVAAQTQSADFPMRGNGFQKTFGGDQDGVVLKIDPTCNNLVWSTYLGGSGKDGAFVLALNKQTNDLYIAGATASDNFPGNTTGVYQNSNKGSIDGFVTQISNDGSTQIRTTFIGTTSFDAVYGIQFDRKGFPYIMGICEGRLPVINAAYSKANSAQFIAKMRPDLSGFIYYTVFGSGSALPNISPVAFLVDRCENVYISGWGGWLVPSADPYNMSTTVGMDITSDALKKTTDGRDFYFAVIKRDAASLLYGTYFGQEGGEGEHVDGGTSRYDEEGVIYQAICANCFGNRNRTNPITRPFLTTPDAWSPRNGTGDDDCNLAALKIAFNFAGVGAGPKAYFNGVADTSGCVPFTIDLRDTLLNAKQYIWRFGDGSPDVTTTNFQVTHTYTTVGDYRLRLIAIDSASCNIVDTAYLNIRVRADRAFLAMDINKLNPCDSLNYEFINLSTPAAGKPFKANSFTWSFGDNTQALSNGSDNIKHAYTGAGTYNVKLTLTDTSYCNAPESLDTVLRVSPLVKARFETPPVGCAPYTAVFDNTSLAGQQFFWDFGDGSPISTAISPTHLYDVGTYTIKLRVIDSTTCNIIDSTTQTIIVSPKPTAQFTTTPIPPLVNTPTIFYNLSTGGTRYVWHFGDGDSTVKTTLDTVSHQYNATGVYDACLFTYNEYGCLDTACRMVDALIDPLLDVPNAFTPGRFGINGFVFVKGFGIGRMTFKIYNRWGKVVFETTDRKTGWDGTYQGKPQPMDVYAYTLDVEFTDGRKTRKTGDITLIR